MNRSEGIAVDADMVAVHILEFRVAEDVELDGEDARRGVSIRRSIEEAEVLGRGGTHGVWGGGEEEGEAVAG